MMFATNNSRARGVIATVDYARSAFDVIDELDRLTTTTQVHDRLESALASFGYSAFRISGVPEPPARIEPYLLLDGWPQKFSEHYARENYYYDDPVAAWCRRSTAPFEWSEARFDRDAWPRAAEVMDAAAGFGMRAGLCVPVGRSNGVQSCVSVAGQKPDFETEAKRAVHLISLYAHARALALSDPDRPTNAVAGLLTDRERETLTWTASGKSSWEISMILGVSERTVNWYITNSSRKLGAVNRTQAVVQAIRAGEITI
jgi:LuxR family transcriptional regulator, quorum-sensing system regulator BjaR1